MLFFYVALEQKKYCIVMNDFMRACYQGNLDEVMRLDPTDMHADNEHAFIITAGVGHLHVIQWLVEYASQNDSPIDIHADNEHAFR